MLCEMEWMCMCMLCIRCQIVTFYLEFLGWCIFIQSYCKSLMMLAQECSQELLSCPPSSDSLTDGILLIHKNNWQYFKHIFSVCHICKQIAVNSGTPHMSRLIVNSYSLAWTKDKSIFAVKFKFHYFYERKARESNVWVSVANSNSKLSAA